MSLHIELLLDILTGKQSYCANLTRHGYPPFGGGTPYYWGVTLLLGYCVAIGFISRLVNGEVGFFRCDTPPLTEEILSHMRCSSPG